MDPVASDHLIQSLVGWIREYPGWSNSLVFAAAMLESLVLVGMLVPGAALMLGAGALIALGALELWPTLAWAAAGAVAGDGVSFWVGYRYRDQLLRLWPFSRFTGLLHRGEDFFRRHGGKSVVFGRFVGPVRAVIPTVAGMMGMTPLRFAIINVLSALAWAPAYILPGMVFGASLELASEVAVRLVLSVALLVVALWLSRWLVRRVFLLFAPRANQLAARTLDWSRNHPLLGRLTRALVDPQQPESRALAVLAVLLLSTGMAFSYVLWRLLSQSSPPQVDTGVNSLLQSLRTPWGDNLMVAVTMLGDAAVYLPLAATVLLWLLWRRNFAAAWHWLAALGFGILLSHTLQWTLETSRPQDLYAGLTSLALPSGHTTISTVLYGFLAVLAARELRTQARLPLYMAAGAMIVLIAFSRLYLSAHWFSDVAGGFTLGLAWVAVLGIAYRRHDAPRFAAGRLLAVATGALLLFGALHVGLHHERESRQYAPQVAVETLSREAWWRDAWRALPPFRDDVVGSQNQPLNVQWAGTLDEIRQRLGAQGWRAPAPFTARTTLYWLLPEVRLMQLPVLPQVHAGHHDELTLTRATDNEYQWVLRLWRTNRVLEPGATPLWIGSVSTQILQRRLGLVSYPITTTAFDQPLAALAKDLGGWDWRRVQRADAPARTQVHWNGDLLLVRPAPATP